MQKMSVIETTMLRWVSGNTLIDRIRNENICKQLDTPIEHKMKENQVNSLDICNEGLYTVRKSERIVFYGVRRTKDRPKQTVKKGRGVVNLTMEMTFT